MDMPIVDVYAEILDSRGALQLRWSSDRRSSVGGPRCLGASAGAYEAVELRDGRTLLRKRHQTERTITSIRCPQMQLSEKMCISEAMIDQILQGGWHGK